MRTLLAIALVFAGLLGLPGRAAVQGVVQPCPEDCAPCSASTTSAVSGVGNCAAEIEATPTATRGCGQGSCATCANLPCKLWVNGTIDCAQCENGCSWQYGFAVPPHQHSGHTNGVVTIDEGGCNADCGGANDFVIKAGGHQLKLTLNCACN